MRNEASRIAITSILLASARSLPTAARLKHWINGHRDFLLKIRRQSFHSAESSYLLIEPSPEPDHSAVRFCGRRVLRYGSVYAYSGSIFPGFGLSSHLVSGAWKDPFVAMPQ